MMAAQRRASYCECGNEKAPTLEACDRCMFLDGYMDKETRIVHALRMAVVPINVDEIASDTGIEVRSVLRSIKSLLASGRVLSATVEGRTLYRLGEHRA